MAVHQTNNTSNEEYPASRLKLMDRRHG
jgi:hypothetical protein